MRPEVRIKPHIERQWPDCYSKLGLYRGKRPSLVPALVLCSVMIVGLVLCWEVIR